MAEKKINFKKELGALRIARSRKEKQDVQLANAITDLQGRIHGIGQEYQMKIQHEQTSQRTQLSNTCTTMQDAEIAEKTQELNTLRSKYDADVSANSLELITARLYEDCPVDTTVQGYIADIKNTAVSIFNEDFVSTYFKLTSVDVEEDVFLESLEMLDTVHQNLMYFTDSKVSGWLGGISDFIRDFNFTSDTDSSSKKLLVRGAILVVACVFAPKFYSVYAILLLCVCVYNLRRAYFTKQSLDILNIVETNMGKITAALDTKAISEHADIQCSLKTEYEGKSTLLQKQISDLQQDVVTVRNRAMSEFNFDSTSLVTAQNQKINALKEEIAVKQREQGLIRQDIVKIGEDFTKLQEQYENEVDSVVERHINFTTIGDSFLFPKKFLIDDGDPLKFFDNAASSHFFLYKDLPTVYNFIKLMCVQLRTLMHPDAVRVQIWDSAVAGTPFMPLRNPDSGGDPLGISISSTTEGIKEELGALEQILQKRMKVIKLNYTDIEAYNKDMLQLKAVPESYTIVFVLTTKSLEEDEQYLRLLKTGAELGICVYTFVDTNIASNSHNSLINNSDYCANIGVDVLNPSASAAMRETIVQLQEARKR